MFWSGPLNAKNDKQPRSETLFCFGYVYYLTVTVKQNCIVISGKLKLVTLYHSLKMKESCHVDTHLLSCLGYKDLLILKVFNDPVSPTATWQDREGFGRRRGSCKVPYRHFVERLVKFTKYFGQDANQLLPEYKYKSSCCTILLRTWSAFHHSNLHMLSVCFYSRKLKVKCHK
jgi:hypothetical protein